MTASSQPDPNVRYDRGGWISGPSIDEALLPVRMVSPNSTAVRELLLAVADALTLTAPESLAGEVTYLRIARSRGRLVMLALRSLLRDRDDCDDRDIMQIADRIRNEASQYPDDQYRGEGDA